MRIIDKRHDKFNLTVFIAVIRAYNKGRGKLIILKGIAMVTKKILVGLFWILAVISAAFGEIRLPAVLSDNMVLQQQSDVKLWGWADPNEEIVIGLSWADRDILTTADDQGDWSVSVQTPDHTQKGKIIIKGKNQLTIDNILFGEVWLCSGQSNMQWPLHLTNDADNEIPAADYSEIRLFTVPRVASSIPQADCDSQWVVCSPQTAREFSAVGYYFGKFIYEELKVPVGLIHSSWGGSDIIAWIDNDTLGKDPDYDAHKAVFTNLISQKQQALTDYVAELEKWKTGQLAFAPPMPNRIFSEQWGSNHMHSGLYNAMIAPIVNFDIRGSIWYQGESNAGRAYQYRRLMPMLIRNWRDVFENPEMPFLYVQLANYNNNGFWPELREAQLMALSVPHTAMAVTIDIGDADNIHPRNKRDVGKRLALGALATVYGRDVPYSGPIYSSMQIQDNKAILYFSHTDGGLLARGGPLKGFTIAAEGEDFIEAKAVIEGDKVIVSNPKVQNPAAVRYAWSNNPAEANLYNKAGLPASPFRTDDRPGVTMDAK